MSRITGWFTQSRRAWIYRSLTAGAPVAAFYGLVADEALPLWLGMAAAVLGTGMAAANTPTKEPTNG